MPDKQTLFEAHPLPWRFFPKLYSRDLGFIRDARGGAVCRDIYSNEIGEWLVEKANAEAEGA